ncbi:helix-turn-helix domain-containing protein [Methylobacterium sp. Leaf99]|uniref:helix-turn-helix domain-containing protein n=1 Tax=Methylobacterium sp. Leaf99 TaxID=1736251 RepID=UPI0009E6BEE7|nr:helix-turn-helix transcriptional regulator [Methylobacterium sp. Leaf99]
MTITEVVLERSPRFAASLATGNTSQASPDTPRFSKEWLAADAGVDRAYLGGLERHAENPTVDLFAKVAEALAVPLSEFFIV